MINIFKNLKATNKSQIIFDYLKIFQKLSEIYI